MGGTGSPLERFEAEFDHGPHIATLSFLHSLYLPQHEGRQLNLEGRFSRVIVVSTRGTSNKVYVPGTNFLATIVDERGFALGGLRGSARG